jgi:hypothetical protein
MYWTLQSFSVLSVGIDPGNKQKCVRRLLCMQPGLMGGAQSGGHDNGVAAPRRRLRGRAASGRSPPPHLRRRVRAGDRGTARRGRRVGPD